MPTESDALTSATLEAGNPPAEAPAQALLLKLAAELEEARKLATLGNLVASLTHELNTPIGSSLTAASTLHDRVKQIRAQAAHGTLKRSELNDFLNACEEAAVLQLRGLSFASDLIANFKQVATDQASKCRRNFELAKVLTEVVSMLMPSLRKTGHRINLDVPAGIVLDSYPGALEQVAINIINNSLVHGFAGVEHGAIHIEAKRRGPAVELVFSDDGVGIPAAHLPQVFAPFYSTRLEHGSSGLGLYLVHDLVTQALGGQVQLDSGPKRGTRIALTLPLRAPDG